MKSTIAALRALKEIRSGSSTVSVFSLPPLQTSGVDERWSNVPVSAIVLSTKVVIVWGKEKVAENLVVTKAREHAVPTPVLRLLSEYLVALDCLQCWNRGFKSSNIPRPPELMPSTAFAIPTLHGAPLPRRNHRQWAGKSVRGFPSDFHVARYRERDFVAFLPEWVPCKQLLRRKSLSLGSLQFRCFP
uniref:Uncharacterized protein n=1 Tax=Ananas comosus var. bracteatus TaxID=296719 RepID=A0A6V7QH01_ANACO|nr:unnamed protein product [Ananas comosus var. bracteatus]